MVDQNQANSTWEVVENSTSVQLNVSTSNNTLSFQVGWGAVREVTSKGKLVKAVDPVAENWRRTIEQNATTIVVTYSVTETRSPWQDSPIKISLSTVLGLHNDSETVATAKFSLSVDGDWKFEQSSNILEADFVVQAALESIQDCGKNQKYQLDSSSVQDVYHFGSTGSTAVSLGILRSCVADGVQRSTSTLTPVFNDNNTAVNVTIRFPSFNSSLYYDPNFALLLGFTGSSCNQLLTWILPAAFLGGAAVIIVLVIMASYLPIVQPLILGPEGSRIHNLREFVSNNHLGLGSDLNIVSDAPKTAVDDGW